MRPPNPSHLRALFRQMLADSLSAPLPESTPRSVHKRISLPGKASVVIGMRRSGKTTFLHQIRRQKVEEGVPRQRLPYINFEDERLVGIKGEHLGLLIEEYYRQFPAFRGKETVFWFFDEIHAVAGWEKFIRRLLDTEKVEVFLTGSSGALLSREVATSMRGRGWEVVIHPFSFEEFLRHNRYYLPQKLDALTSRQHSELENALLSYLHIGGFPEVQGLSDSERFELLRQYVDVVVMRDVMERYGITNLVALRWLVRQLLANPGGFFSAERFYRDLKSQAVAVSRDTLHQMISAVEDCFLVRICWLDSDSERRRMVNPRKVYPVDTGLIPVFDRSGSANIGHALETAVRIELERRGMEVSYARTRTGLEVDFLARRPGEKPKLIQVCADIGSPETLERQVRALEACAMSYPNASLHLVTLTTETVAEFPQNIRLHSAAVWLLDQNA